MWSISRVRNYLAYSSACPAEVGPCRWNAMVAYIRRVYG
jgi:hypothetical protein